MTSIYLYYIFYEIDRPKTKTDKIVSNVEESSSGGLIIGITVAAVVVLTVIIIIMVVYYKRRVGRLKSENCTVMHYIQSTEGTDAGDYTKILITKIIEQVVCVFIDTSCQKKNHEINEMQNARHQEIIFFYSFARNALNSIIKIYICKNR